MPRRPKNVLPASQITSDLRKRRLRTCSSCCKTSSRAMTSASRRELDRLDIENETCVVGKCFQMNWSMRSL